MSLAYFAASIDDNSNITMPNNIDNNDNILRKNDYSIKINN